MDHFNRPPVFKAVAALLLILVVAWPGDAPFINDEALLITSALDANAQGRPARHGLVGTVGIHYGPVPTWIYQVFLVFTRDLILISMIKNILVWSLILGFMVHLSSLLAYSRYAMLVVLLSPFLYIYNRMLWDNCFLIPLAAGVFTACVAFLNRPSLKWVVIGASLIVLQLYIHPMSAIPAAAYIAGVAVFGRSWIRIHWPRVLAVAAVSTMVLMPFVVEIPGQMAVESHRASTPVVNAIRAAGGATYFSFVHWGRIFYPEMFFDQIVVVQPLLSVLIVMTAAGLVFFVLGILHAAGDLRQTRIVRRTWSLHDKVAAIALIVIVLQTVFFVVSGQTHQPHYHVAGWPASFYFIWRFMSLRELGRVHRVLCLLYAFSMAACLFIVVNMIHIHGGNQSMAYGATLKNQIDVAARLGTRPSTALVASTVRNYQQFPHTLRLLGRLYGDTASSDSIPPDTIRVLIDYARTPRDYSGRLTVRYE